MAKLLMGLFVCTIIGMASSSTLAEASISRDSILDAAHRNPAFAARDNYRHPLETLAFFDVLPEIAAELRVVEIWPGLGWYTELLAPYLKGGVLYAAHFPTDVGVPFYNDYQAQFMAKLTAHPAVYENVEVAVFDPKRAVLSVPDGTVDHVLTFRNVHNWLRSESEATAFELFYKALKPGGVLGVVEHRAAPDTNWQTMKVSGYMTEQYVIELAEKAGFVLEAKSEINANPRDTKDHPKGVWTLPPTLRLKELDRDKYLAIGESDRMTLKFKKPVAQVELKTP